MNVSVPTKSVINGYSRESDYTYAVASCSSLDREWVDTSGYISSRTPGGVTLTITNAVEEHEETTTVEKTGNGNTTVTCDIGLMQPDGSWIYSGVGTITAPGTVVSASITGFNGEITGYSGDTITVKAESDTKNARVTIRVRYTYEVTETVQIPASNGSASGTDGGYNNITSVSPSSGVSNGIRWSASGSGSTVTVTASGPNGTCSASYYVTHNRRYESSGYWGDYYGSDTVRIPTGLTNANLTSCSRVSGTSATVSRVNSTHARCNWSGLSSSSASTNCRLNYSYDSPNYEDRADVVYVDSNGQSHDVDYINFNGNVYP